MIADTTSHRVFKISELTRLITSHLLTSPRVITSNDLLTSRKAVVNLACACRYLEEPVLSTLWGIVASLERLLRVLPRETWDRDHLESGENVVCGPDLLLELNAYVSAYFSSGSWGTHHKRTGREYTDTRLGCAVSPWMSTWSSRKQPPKNYASIHPQTDGSRRCKTYLGVSRNPISLMST